MSYDINILVNGNRCKQYHHLGKIFIEAKDGSEYTIEIKNNEWKRILAVCSVDGLDILTGKKALEGNAGYVISGLNTGKFEGFRVSDDKVAKFLFGAKGDSYAASKGDKSERNVGVIGVRIFEEKIKPAPIVVREEHHHHHHDYWWNQQRYGSIGTPCTPLTPLPGTIWCDTTLSGGPAAAGASPMGNIRGGNATYSSNLVGASLNDTECSDWMDCERERSSPPTKGQAKRLLSAMSINNLCDSPLRSQALGFDMGTKWGEAKESKVIEVEFERGILALSTNIYYASRQSLIEMGVPLGTEKQVSFPEPFADSKYAKPPKNWKG